MKIVPWHEIREQVFTLYRSGGFPRGSLTGWPSIDKHYTVGLGQWTLITGNPNSGKSEWLDALMVNLAKQESWRFYIFSPENWPLALHHIKILEKYIGKPFGPGPTERMDEDDIEAGEQWLKNKFVFAKPDRPDLLSILYDASWTESATGIVKIGVVVDPWNSLEHNRLAHQSETEYISQTLTTVIDHVRERNYHLWLVAHPAKIQKDRDGKYPVPRPSDVSGSAHWWNKADNCITVWRDPAADSQDVDIHVQKVRFKHIGRIGGATLRYDRTTGRYHDKSDVVSIANYYGAHTGGATRPQTEGTA